MSAVPVTFTGEPVTWSVEMPWGVITLSIEDVTPERAKEFLAQNTRNRDIRPRHVRSLAEDMRNKDFNWNGDTITFDVSGVMNDGQHRCLACIASGVPFTALIVRGMPADTQNTVDTGASRKYGDILKMRGEGNYNALAAAVRGIAAWEAGMVTIHSTRAFTNAELDRVLARNPWIREGMPTIKKVGRIGLPASAAGALWWVFMGIDAEDAEGFFDRLCSDEGHREGDPITALRRFLLASKDHRGKRTISYLTAVTIKAWNKYRDGEEVSHLRYRAGGANPEPFPEPK